jgi:1-acyl-sn-glycerol-3-phosphate acyltransferase
MSLSYLWAVLFKAPVIIVSTVIFGAVSVTVSFFERGGSATDWIARTWAHWLLIVAGVSVRIRGLENISPDGNYVFVGNHLSLYDTPVVLTHVPNRFLFLVNSKYVQLPFLGTHLQRTGHFSIDLDDARGSLKVLTQAAKAMRERHLSILLFPEGSRARDEMGEFKEGAAYMAIKTGVPVIPFAIWGTREVLPIGSHHVSGGVVDLVFGEPIPTADYTTRQRSEFNELLRSTVARMVEDVRR